jgi:diketogulonate reductase-like aldo/keto reductase
MGWDRDVRRFCKAHGLHYQGFSLLTANPGVLRHPRLDEIARRTGAGHAQIVFAFARQVGMIALTGTTSAQHMQEDLESRDLALEADEVDTIEQRMV